MTSIKLPVQMEKEKTTILFTNKQAFHLCCMFFLPHFNVACKFSVLSNSLFFFYAVLELVT